MDKPVEHVLAVPTEKLRPYLTGRGLLRDRADEVLRVILENHVFLPRPAAEEDPGYRQIIPYVALLRGGEVFSTRRLRGGTEQRLHGRISLGVGGHINPEADGDGDDVLLRGLRREIEEEVAIDGGLDLAALRFEGIINDDANEVSLVHLGLFCTLPVAGEVAVRETFKIAGAWLRRDDLPRLAPEMETWSSLIIDALR
jgi:predicted NUDIX family phosphoesterase